MIDEFEAHLEGRLHRRRSVRQLDVDLQLPHNVVRVVVRAKGDCVRHLMKVEIELQPKASSEKDEKRQVEV